MKRIRFDNMKNWIWIAILFLSGGFIVSGSFDLFENPNTNKAVTIVGFLFQMIYFSRMFWYRNYVQWNKKGIFIQVNSWSGKSLSFDQIKKTELIEKKLIINKGNGNKVSFDLNEISKSDTQKLNEIIVKNTP